MYTIVLSCGHTARKTWPYPAGTWVSCWAIMHPARGCQAQRKIISVTIPAGQGALW